MKTKGYKPKKDFTTKQKIIGSALMILLYRFLSFIPLPFVDNEYIKTLIGANGSLGLLNILSGGSLGNMSLMALGIGPWITASIVLQLIGMAFPRFDEMRKEEEGKTRYKIITLIVTIFFALAESIGMIASYGRSGYLTNYHWYTVLLDAFLMMLGTGILSLMGWYIDEKLFGNGTSLILTAGILCSYVGDGRALISVLSAGKIPAVAALLCVTALILFILLFAYTVFIQSCEKRIQVIYSRKLSMTGNMKNTNTIPLQLLSGGVVPIIFASTIITLPSLIGLVFGLDAEWLEIFNSSHWLRDHWWVNIGLIAYLVLIVAFSYFCQTMYVNPVELAQTIQKHGGTVPGVRPGKPTTDYIISQARWFVGLGSLFLCVIAILPMVVSSLIGISNLSFLGTSILITVSTISDTWKLWEADKLSKSYHAKINKFGK